MKSIRVLGRTAENRRQGTIRIFKENEEQKAVAFMKHWLQSAESGDIVFAVLYEDGEKKIFLKGFKKP